MRRILAWTGILLIAAAFLALIIFTAAGAPSNLILALLTCLLVLPVLFYGLLLFAKLKKGGCETEGEDEGKRES